MRRFVAVYALSMVIFALGVGGVLYLGKDLSVRSTEKVELSLAPAKPPPVSTRAHAEGASLWAAFEQNLSDPLSRLLLQFIVIVLATGALGSLFLRFGQPSVIGEIVAGIMLGPSLFGWLWPGGAGFVFPKGSLGALQLFSQIGVCLFMFVVGFELEVGHLRQRAQAAIIVSHTSIVVPYLLGVTMAYLLFSSFGAPGTSFVTFALFIGIAMSITAFPVLARILRDRGIAKTPVGVMATTCAAVGDATAWIILAFVVATGRSLGVASTLTGLGLLAVFLMVMLWGVRPLLARWFDTEKSYPTIKPGLIAAILVFMTAAALATQVIGIHALFGAFLAGAIMPRSETFRENLTTRLEHFSSVFLLPLFFAFSGLRTQLGLLNDATSWLICSAIIVVATAGKLGGTMLAARLTGVGWNTSFLLGALMNTRGLVELIALNIGYDLGILPPRIFSMLVLMALVTTFMTGPLLNFAEQFGNRRSPSCAATT